MIERQQPSVFPVALLLKGRRCLVLGGGKVATRKILLLLDAEATVSVVSPELSVELQQLGKEHAFRWIPRSFEPSDLDGMFLVYAATNNRIANRAALNLCRQRGILCCPVDNAWADGDFLTPATLRDGDLTIAVNTAGHACRRSRLVKQSLARHIECVNHAELLVIGTSHEQLDITAREALQYMEVRLNKTALMIFRVWGVHEFYLLNTCNRLELHAIGVPDPDGISLLLRILGFDRLPPDAFYVKTGRDAFEHACALCSGLLSQMTGESHIVAQIKDALKDAQDGGWAGGMMQEWMDAVLHVSGHCRSGFDASAAKREIEDLALDFLKHFLLEADRDLRFMILGSGKIGTALFEKVTACYPSASIDWFWHRTPPSPPKGTKVRLFPLDQLQQHLPDADAVIAALAADHHVLNAEDLKRRGRCPSPMVVLDLGMPRNVAPIPQDALPEGIRLMDLDALKGWDQAESAQREKMMNDCREQVLEHKAYYEKLVASYQGRNTQQ